MTAPPLAGLRGALVRAAGDAIAPRGAGKGRLCIVNYHRILESFDPLRANETVLADFEWQMQVLADNFNVLPLEQAIAQLRSGRMPPRAVSITFDDGYRSTHDLALPVLRRLGLPATVFITTGFIDSGNMWNDQILEALRTAPLGELDLRAHGLENYAIASEADRARAAAQAIGRAKYLPPDQRAALLAALADRSDHGPDLMLTADMIRALAAAGIAIGAHTVSHPILTKLGAAEAMAEIADSKQQLEAITGLPVNLFAYPNGKYGIDFDQRHMDMARQAGFHAAFTTALGAASNADDPFAIPRSLPWDATPARFALRLLRWLLG